MTGIIICDKCGKIFLAHGSRDSLPEELSKIKLFIGYRFIESKENLHQPITTISKFMDLCNNCQQKVASK